VHEPQVTGDQTDARTATTGRLKRLTHAYIRNEALGGRWTNGGTGLVSVDIRAMVRQGRRSGGAFGRAFDAVLQPDHELEPLEDAVDRGRLVVDQPRVQPQALDDLEGEVGLDRRGLLGPGHPEPAGRVQRANGDGEATAEVGEGRGEQEHHVEWSSCRPGERRSGRHRPEREPARCADDQDAGPLADPELVRERRRRVVAVSGRRSRGGHVRHCSGVPPRATSFGGSPPCIAWDHRDMGGYLYVVGTPIGNLADLSDRARETLATVDLVAAEDTRRTGRLLEHIGVKVRMLSLFEGNERQRIDELLDRLRDGERVALVSDSGMPAVSDPGVRVLRPPAALPAGERVAPLPAPGLPAAPAPGFPLLRAAADAGIQIRVVPGPSAV